MGISRRSVLGVSLAVIALNWVRVFYNGQHAQATPLHFGEMVTSVLVTKTLTVLLVLCLLRLGDEKLGSLGVRKDDWPRHTAFGVVAGLAMFVLLNVALTTALNALLPSPPDTERNVLAMFKSPRNLLIWLPIGVIGGGFVEELERIFILTRFEQWLGRNGLVLGVGLSSVFFGVGHLYQGRGNALSVVVSGVVFALLYLRKRSAIEPMVAHAFSDILAMVAATMLAK